MRDEIFDRDFQAGRAELFAGVDQLVHSIADGFAQLNRRQWSAPWKGQQDRRSSQRTGIA